MEENKNLNSSQRNENQITQPDLDELVKSIPDRNSFADTKNSNLDMQQKEKTPKPEGYKTNSFVYYFFCVFGIMFFSIFYLFQIHLKPIVIVGHSMLPEFNAKALSDTDETHCDVVYYREKSNYSYGDVIIISNENDQYIDNSNNIKPVDFLIKRIVACPGDTLTFFLTDISEDGFYYYYDISVKDTNGNQIELNESEYINEPMYLIKNYHYIGILNQVAQNILNDSLGLDNREFSITINENCYFAMGDNRNHSLDCRTFGEVSKEDIRGNVRLHVKYGENIWIALFNKIKSYISVNYLNLKENL